MSTVLAGLPIGFHRPFQCPAVVAALLVLVLLVNGCAVSRPVVSGSDEMGLNEFLRSESASGRIRIETSTAVYNGRIAEVDSVQLTLELASKSRRYRVPTVVRLDEIETVAVWEFPWRNLGTVGAVGLSTLAVYALLRWLGPDPEFNPDVAHN